MTKKTFPMFLILLALLTSISGAATQAQKPGVVNVNTATVEQLQLLPRVGPALAGRIIEFRDANGAFKATEELVAVKGIGEKSLISLAPYLAVSGETTLTEKVKLPRSKSDASTDS